MKKLFLIIGLFLPLLGFAQDPEANKDKNNEQLYDKEGPNISEEFFSNLSEAERLYNLLILKENEVKNLKEDNEILQDLNNQLLEDKEKALRNNIRLASMFIYAPYNEMLINNYAIPTFDKAKENELPLFYESTYQAIFEILKNYKNDCEVIATLFNNARKVDSSGKAKGLAVHLEMTSTYKRYSEFNGWESTYLGYLMNSLLNELKNYSANSPKKINDLGAIFFVNWNQQK